MHTIQECEFTSTEYFDECQECGPLSACTCLASIVQEWEIVTARQIIFFLIRPCYLLSLKNVGDRYKKDHATILHGINQASAQVEWDRQYRANVERICYLLNEIGYAKPMIFFNKFVDHIEYKKELARKKKSKIK